MKTKTNQAREAYLNGDVKTALRIASSFRLGLSREESILLKRGYECLVHPTFYIQLGMNPEKTVADALDLFRSKFLTESLTHVKQPAKNLQLIAQTI